MFHKFFAFGFLLGGVFMMGWGSGVAYVSPMSQPWSPKVLLDGLMGLLLGIAFVLAGVALFLERTVEKR
jgi:hypothetical protein